MNKQKERENKKSEELLKNYEHNLKLHQESKRKILDIILLSSMPHQVHNIKTIVWMNLLFLGLSIQIFKNMEQGFIHIVFYGTILLSISLMLVALLRNRYKWYGGYDDIEYSHTIYDNKYSKSDMLGTLLKNDDIAITKNREIMKNTSGFMRGALMSTFLGFALFASIIMLSVHQPTMKGGDKIMADDKNKPASPSTQPVNTGGLSTEASERSLGNTTAQTPKDSNSTKK